MYSIAFLYISSVSHKVSSIIDINHTNLTFIYVFILSISLSLAWHCSVFSYRGTVFVSHFVNINRSLALYYFLKIYLALYFDLFILWHCMLSVSLIQYLYRSLALYYTFEDIFGTVFWSIVALCVSSPVLYLAFSTWYSLSLLCGTDV